jgi:peptide/nickel transport system substrate-binding protein
MEIRQLELSTFLSVAQGAQRDFDALITLVPGDLALGHVAALFAGETGPLAYSGLQNAGVTEALSRVRQALTTEDLAGGWRDVQLVLEREFPATWLYHARGVQGVNRRVRGVSLDLRGELAGVAGWWIADGEELP